MNSIAYVGAVTDREKKIWTSQNAHAHVTLKLQEYAVMHKYNLEHSCASLLLHF
jgi:hypothetical protein